MKNLINIKYRLKLDNEYIRGNENSYISVEELFMEDILLLGNSINVLTLEWYWENDDINDTIVGSKKTDEYYTLNLTITSTEYNK